MQRTNDLTKNVMKIAANIARYTLYFLIVVIVPLISEPLATQFDWCKLKWSEPGELHPFFAEMFTIFLWLLALAVVTTVQARFQKAFDDKKAMLSGKGIKTDTDEAEASVKAKPCVKSVRKNAKKDSALGKAQTSRRKPFCRGKTSVGCC